MTPAKPSLELLRSLTDEHVLRALMEDRRLTRAELATRTGISKPTVSDSVRRLTAAGLLRDTGVRTTGRGGVGSYYALADDLGSALVVSIAPEGIVAETINVHGEVMGREVGQVPRSARSARVAQAVRAVARRAQATIQASARLAVVSVADPVDRLSGKLVHLPDAPFLIGELAPAEVLAPLVAGPITVDNDVHWAARAERHAAPPGALDDFAYVYLGEGLGCAVVSDGDVLRGHRGIAGEIAHVITRGPRGRAIPFTELFADLRLRRNDSTAVDIDAVLRAIEGTRAPRVRTALAEAISGVLTALVTLADPRVIVVGGTWGPQPAILESVVAEFSRQPRHVPVQAAQVTDEPSLAGARHHALHELRSTILAQPHEAHRPKPGAG
jgi:predicted NBD/HSP70 family sugar kinase